MRASSRPSVRASHIVTTYCGGSPKRIRQSWAVAGLPAQVRAAFADVNRARLDIAETHLGVERAKRWMVQANRDYLVGLADSQALVDAVRAYAELRAAELEAAFRHNGALAQLAYATGTIVADELGLYPGKDAP